MTPLIPANKTNQFHSLHCPSGLLKHEFAFPKKRSNSDCTKSMKNFGRIYTGHAHVLLAQVGSLTYSVYIMQWDTVHGEGIPKPAIPSQPAVKHHVGVGSVDSESSIAV